MYIKRLKMNFIYKLLFFDINDLAAYKVWRDMNYKAISCKDNLKNGVGYNSYS